ncbi:beta-catenin-like protein 1, partial [Lecanoromycetidae sp. Uapishka_2]
MTSLDDLFKAHEVYKAAKLSTNGDVKTNGKHTMLEEEDEEDIEAGPDMPPAEVEEGPDDEEGRFFGGGITRGTADVLDFMDDQDQNELVGFMTDLSCVMFMGSEADLDADLKALSILSEHPNLYEEFAKLGCVASLVSLLSHENTDIAIDAIEIIDELTDEDVEAEQEQWDALVDALLEADLLNLLYENVLRLNEDIESDRAGIYHVLSIIENLSSRPSIVSVMGNDTRLLPWLLARIQRSEPTVTQNKQYSAEVLTILLQSSPTNRTKLISTEGIDALLQLLSPYRKRDPAKGTEEEEYTENVFDCLTCCVDDADGKAKFLEAEGIELCLIMFREGKMSRPRALRLLDHALGGPDGGACCERLIEAAGLKVTFSLVMKKQDNEATEHLLGILSSMLRSLPANEAPRIRLLAKFVEKNYQVPERLTQIRREYAARVSVVTSEIKAERGKTSAEELEERADEWLSRRLDAGLFVLQTADTILAWLVAEDDGARSKIQSLLSDRDETLDELKLTLKEQVDTMNANPEDEDSMLKDMLSTLIQHL